MCGFTSGVLRMALIVLGGCVPGGVREGVGGRVPGGGGGMGGEGCWRVGECEGMVHTGTALTS